MTTHDFTAGPPTTLEADALADEQVDKQLGRHTTPDVDDMLGLNDVPDDGPEDNSDLNAIRDELHAGGGINTRTLGVDSRPGWAIEFDITFTAKDVDRIRKASHDRSFDGKIDGIKFAALLIAKTAVRILRHGQPIPLESGRPATFTEPEFLDMFKRDDERQPIKAVEGVKRLYILEGHIEATAKALMNAAGWNDEARETDPIG
jgi:hypothetical protein